MRTISIIGAGAAGLMTAATIIEGFDSGEYHIHLFDKNPIPGIKVALAGGGRCNLTTGIEDKKVLLSKYTRGGDFIRKALGKFSPGKCREWFESHGLPLKMEGDYRVFPASDDGRDVVEIFENIFAKHQGKITLHYDEGVSAVSIFPLQEGVSKQFIVTTPKGTYESDILIITTGGNAYAHTGSNGDGYAFARSLGHTITKLGPSLSSFLTGEKWTHELSGLAFESARITFSLSFLLGENPFKTERDSPSENDKEKELSGPLLFTHFGISGPLAFQLSSHLAWEDIKSKIVTFSPISDMDFALWNGFLKEQFGLHPKKLITSILTDKLPRRFAEGFVEGYFSHIKEIFAASISREERERIAKLLGEGIPLTLLERRPGDEFVTAGGVDTLEVNPETMESKIQKNLYFAGEVLNVDAVTGGFNLQACWAGGYVSGQDIIKKIEFNKRNYILPVGFS